MSGRRAIDLGDALRDDAERRNVEVDLAGWRRNSIAAADLLADLDNQIKRLADVIMFEVPGEPSEDGGAIDCAIRLLRGHVWAPPRGERVAGIPPWQAGRHLSMGER